jgi:hypothetical protein
MGEGVDLAEKSNSVRYVILSKMRDWMVPLKACAHG